MIDKDFSDQGSKERIMTPRKKADLALKWATTHVVNPCGNTPEKKEYMRGVHIMVVRDALKEPGVRETLTGIEKEILKFLGVDKEEP